MKTLSKKYIVNIQLYPPAIGTRTGTITHTPIHTSNYPSAASVPDGP